MLFASTRSKEKDIYTSKLFSTALLQIIIVTDVRVSVLHHGECPPVVTLLVLAGAAGEGPPLQTQLKLLLAWEGSSLEILLLLARVITHDAVKRIGI